MSIPRITEVVGFDLGHGETALARISMDSHQTNLLEINNKEKQISAIAYDEKRDQYYIGEQAYNRPGVTDFAISFKNKPSKATPEQRWIIQKFVEVIYSHLKKERLLLSEAEDGTHFFVGYPSGWSDKEKIAYQSLLAESGIPILTVARESRAALLYAQEEAQLIKIKELSGRPILVVDLGSSTIDLTLVQGASDKPLTDFGRDLGASLIDKAILRRTLTDHEAKIELERIFKEYAHYRNRCELLCRRTKEIYFNDPDFYEDPEVELSAGLEKIPTKNGKIIFSPDITGPVMKSIIDQPLTELGGQSWPDAFRTTMEEAREKIAKQGVKPSVVFLTGGAARMQFVIQICEEVFADEDTRCLRDSKPEFTIARGLALWGWVYLRTEQFMAEAETFIDKKLPRIVEKHLPALLEDLAESLAESLLNKVVKIKLDSWRKGKISTLADLEDVIKEKSANWVKGDEARSKMSKTIKVWLTKEVTNDIEQEFSKIRKTFYISGKKSLLTISKIEHGTNIEGLVIDDPTAMEDTIALILGIIVPIIVVIFVAIGPGGWIAGIIGVLISWFTGASITETIRTTNFYVWVRKRILSDDKIAKLIAEKKPEVKQSLLEAFNKDKKLKSALKQTISHQLQADAKKNADEMRLDIL